MANILCLGACQLAVRLTLFSLPEDLLNPHPVIALHPQAGQVQGCSDAQVDKDAPTRSP